MGKFHFYPESWALFVVLDEEKNKLHLKKLEKFLSEGFHFPQEFKVCALDSKRGNKVLKSLFKDKATKEFVTLSLESVLDEANWDVQLSKSFYLLNNRIISFVKVDGIDDFYDCINSIEQSRVTLENPILCFEVMTKEDEKGENYSPIIFYSYDEIKEAHPQRIL